MVEPQGRHTAQNSEVILVKQIGPGNGLGGGATSLGARHRSLRGEVYVELRRRIISGELAPGHRLVERDLAAELEVSRVTLREALQQLAAESFVVTHPRRGAVVTPMGPTEVRDLFDTRESLEVLAARLAAERRSDDGLAALGELLEQARQATEHGDDDRIASVNAAFHDQIVRLADNARLTAMMDPVAGAVQRLFHLAQPIYSPRMWEEHRLIHDAIARGDADEAARISRDHIASSRGPTMALFDEPADATDTEAPPEERDR
jgi:DNA-binding GntR family transcriptional regulator